MVVYKQQEREKPKCVCLFSFFSADLKLTCCRYLIKWKFSVFYAMEYYVLYIDVIVMKRFLSTNTNRKVYIKCFFPFIDSNR